MAFGKQSGPPATARQVQALLALLQSAGHSDFRDARGPMGFTQRQAAGTFTRDEADAFIEQLEREQDEGSAPSAPGPARAQASKIVPRAEQARSAPAARELRSFSTEELAAELQRRGWVVLEP